MERPKIECAHVFRDEFSCFLRRHSITVPFCLCGHGSRAPKAAFIYIVSEIRKRLDGTFIFFSGSAVEEGLGGGGLRFKEGRVRKPLPRAKPAPREARGQRAEGALRRPAAAGASPGAFGKRPTHPIPKSLPHQPAQGCERGIGCRKQKFSR